MPPTYLSLTPKGETYFRQMVEVGFTKLRGQQHFEWDVLHDLSLQGDDVNMSAFLAEGRDTILGRIFAQSSETTTAHYGKTLHSLISQGYI